MAQTVLAYEHYNYMRPHVQINIPNVG